MGYARQTRRSSNTVSGSKELEARRGREGEWEWDWDWEKSLVSVGANTNRGMQILRGNTKEGSSAHKDVNSAFFYNLSL